MYTIESIADSMIKHATNSFWLRGTSHDIFAFDISYTNLCTGYGEGGTLEDVAFLPMIANKLPL
jgi:hypothetical protein